MDNLPGVLKDLIRDYLMPSKQSMISIHSGILVDVHQYRILKIYHDSLHIIGTLQDILDNINMKLPLLQRTDGFYTSDYYENLY